jgi:hypothetical protein
MKALKYRAVFKNGRACAWLHRVRNLSGAYVIRKKSTHEVQYVGESHSGALAKTIKRHFYIWRDSSRLHYVITGSVYNYEVAIRLCPPNAAKSVQNDLINKLMPQKNKSGFEKEDVGF